MSDWMTAEGWSVEPVERVWLRDAAAWAAEAHEKPVIVNIGVARGASVHCLRAGAPAARLVAIDLDMGLFKGDAGAEMVTGNSADVGWGWEGGPVHVLFVDGDHSRQGVEQDLAAWLPHVAPGGLVAFHDYRSPFSHTRGVAEAVDNWDWTGWTHEGVTGSVGIWRRAESPAGFGRLGFGVAYFRPVYRFWQWWSELLVAGLEPGDVFLNGEDVPAEAMIPRAHNGLVRAFLETDCDTLLILEDDHYADQEVVRRMRYKPANWNFDAVCASYTNRRGTPFAVGSEYVERNEDGSWRMRLDAWQVARTGTQEVPCAALGLALIRRPVLEAMLGDEDPRRFQWFKVVGENSQDIYFYRQMLERGFRAGADRDNWLRHVGQYDWGREDFEQWLEGCEPAPSPNPTTPAVRTGAFPARRWEIEPSAPCRGRGEGGV